MPDISTLDPETAKQLSPEQLKSFTSQPDPTESAAPKEEYLDYDTFSKLNQNQLKSFQAQLPPGTAIKVGEKPKPAHAETPEDIDPEALKQLSPDQLTEFSSQTKWNPIMWAQMHPEHLDPATMQKLSDTFVAINKKGIKLADIPWESIITALPNLVEGGYEMGKLGVRTVRENIHDVNSPSAVKSSVELGAAVETAEMGTADFARRLFNKTGRLLHLQKPFEDYTPEDSLAYFQKELAIRNQMAKVAAGEGVLTTAMGGESLKELLNTGVKLDSEAIQSASAGDPISFAAFGGGFKLFNAVTGKVVGYAASRSAALQSVQKLNMLGKSVERAETLAKDIPSAENIAAKHAAQIAQITAREAASPLAQDLEKAAILGEKAVNFVQELPGTVLGRTIQGAGGALSLGAKAQKKFGPSEVI